MLRHRVLKSLELMLDPGAILGLATWPLFSLTSYQVVKRLVAKGISPATVLDVGANIGQFAVATAMLIPAATIHSFEPLPFCVKRFRHNARKLNNIIIHEMALGSQSGTTEFHVNSYSHSSSVLAMTHESKHDLPFLKEQSVITVKLSTIDEFAAAVELRTPVLLKLDVQGYERETLIGAEATLSRVDYAIIETSFKPTYQNEPLFPEILRFMENGGFSFAGPVGLLIDDKDDVPREMDALFLKTRR